MDMFDMAFELGANFRIINVQVQHSIATKDFQIFHSEKSKAFKKGLSPLTVAAFLAHTEMFFHILNIDRDIYWQVMLSQLNMMIYHDIIMITLSSWKVTLT